MKKLLSLLICASAFGGVTAQTAPSAQPKPVKAPAKSAEILGLSETQFDFGKIPQGRPVTHNFDFKNNGKEDLKLENVQASCGCTTPEWSSEPVAPGATATIKVGYNAAAEGPFTKPVTIVYNNGQVKTINITGTVYKAPATSAPANASITLLKQSNQ